jgi:DNA polymerase III subunit delta
MPDYKQNNINKLFTAVKQGEENQLYLFHGDRFICRKFSDKLIEVLIKNKRFSPGDLKNVNGEEENFQLIINKLRSFSLFSPNSIYRVQNSKILHSKNISESIWKKLEKSAQSEDKKTALRYLLQLLDLAGLKAGQLENNELEKLSEAKWKKQFGFNRPAEKINWISPLLQQLKKSDNASSKKSANSNTETFIKTFDRGIPEGNILILEEEEVDKRKKLYKYIKKHGVIIDLSVNTGINTAAKKSQKVIIIDLINQTLSEFRKKIDSRAVDLLFERIGFQPVAVVMEVEKIAMSIDRDFITAEDVDNLVSRTKEEAIFEINEPFSSGDLNKTMKSLIRFREDGIHPLQIVSGLRNQIRKLLKIRTFIDYDKPHYPLGCSYQVFQKNYLNQLKNQYQDEVILKLHPFPLFILFQNSAKLPANTLHSWLSGLLEAEFQLKSSAISEDLIIENFIFSTRLQQGLAQK